MDVECAPVIITTCNRISHLRACIDSLAKNTLADKTELFISVDYPPNETYVAGHADVCKYLEELKTSSVFKNVYCFFQQRNIGVYNNSNFLKEEIKKRGYRSFIETEDDNEFSRNFLDYCNKNLYRYSQDDSIDIICAYRHFRKEDIQTSTVREHFCRMWGFASWLEKYEDKIKWINNVNVLLFALDIKKMLLFREYNEGAFNIFVEGILINHMGVFFYENGEVAYPDFLQNAYMLDQSKFAIYPKMNLVHNIGADGSGTNSRKGDGVNCIEDFRDIFELDSEVTFANTKHIDAKPGIMNWLRSIKILFKYFYWRAFIKKIA